MEIVVITTLVLYPLVYLHALSLSRNFLELCLIEPVYPTRWLHPTHRLGKIFKFIVSKLLENAFASLNTENVRSYSP